MLFFKLLFSNFERKREFDILYPLLWIFRLWLKCFAEFSDFSTIVLVSATGNLEISIVVCLGAIYVSELLTLDLSLGFHASDQRNWSAVTLSVRSRKILQIFTSQSAPCHFPDPLVFFLTNTYLSFNSIITSTYRQFLSRAGQPNPSILDLGAKATAISMPPTKEVN